MSIRNNWCVCPYESDLSFSNILFLVRESGSFALVLNNCHNIWLSALRVQISKLKLVKLFFVLFELVSVRTNLHRSVNCNCIAVELYYSLLHCFIDKSTHAQHSVHFQCIISYRFFIQRAPLHKGHKHYAGFVAWRCVLWFRNEGICGENRKWQKRTNILTK